MIFHGSICVQTSNFLLLRVTFLSRWFYWGIFRRSTGTLTLPCTFEYIGGRRSQNLCNIIYLYLSNFYLACGHDNQLVKLNENWDLTFLLNCQCIYSSTCFITTSNVYCFPVFLLNAEVFLCPNMYFPFHTLKNFTCLRHWSGIFNVESISDFQCLEISLKSCFMQLCRFSGGSFMYHWELRFPTSDDSELTLALEMVKHISIKFMFLV